MVSRKPTIKQPHISRAIRPSASYDVDGYIRRPVHARLPRRPIVDIAIPQTRDNVLLPATPVEYFDALQGRVPDRSSPSTDFVDLDSGFQAKKKLEQLRHVVRSRLKATKAPTSLPALLIFAVLVTSVLAMANGVSDRQAGADKFGASNRLVDEGDTPSEKRAYNQINYPVAAGLPRFLRISKIGVDTRITRTGVRENSEPKFPDNIFDVGWYENSAKPGEGGAALLIGHLSGSSRNGVFFDLKSLVPGDTLEVETGDGKIHHYYVMKMEAYDRNQVDMDEITKTAIEGVPGLNLMTAVASYERNSDVVQQLVVYTVEDGVSDATKQN